MLNVTADTPKSSPWGPVDQVETLAPGLHDVGTASHGGFLLSPEMNARVPEALRLESGAYEEDCDWARVVVAFGAEYFSEDLMKRARETLKSWAPAAYEAHFGEAIRPGESLVRDREVFMRVHAADLVVFSAVQLQNRTVNGEPAVLARASLGAKRQDGTPEFEFLVPASEYAARDRFGFLIDPARHERVDGPDPTEVYPALFSSADDDSPAP
jgi:hypothetical protein